MACVFAGPALAGGGLGSCEVEVKELQVISPKDTPGADGMTLNIANDDVIVADTGTVYVPIRAVGDALGVPVGWDAKHYTATVGDLQFQAGHELIIDSETTFNHSPVKLFEGRVYVPLHMLDAFDGVEAGWTARGVVLVVR